MPALTSDIMDVDTSQGTQESKHEMSRLWRTWRTVHEMLADRVSRRKKKLSLYQDNLLTVWSLFDKKQGYEVSDEELQISFDDFKNKYSNHLGYPAYVVDPDYPVRW